MNDNTELQMMMLEQLGMLKCKAPRETNRPGSLKERISHGMPVKGSTKHHFKLDARRLGLATAAATGEAVLVRRGKLQQPCVNKGFRDVLGNPISSLTAAVIQKQYHQPPVLDSNIRHSKEYHVDRAKACRLKAHAYLNKGLLGLFHSWMGHARTALKLARS